MEYDESLVVISSPDKDNQQFGTGFIIDQDGGISYILTCAHVVRDVMSGEGQVNVNETIAEIEAMGNPNGADDLAVIRVEGLIGTPLARRNNGYMGLDFVSAGYQRSSSGTAKNRIASAIMQPLQGKLGDPRFLRIRGQHKSVKLWMLNISDSDGFALPQPGCSGAPIVVNTNQEEYVIGVLSMRQGEQIFAISIEELDRVWTEQTHVPFTNREDELKLIISSSAPAYYLLDAPAGYGKSALLLALQKRFFDQQWICAHLILDSPLDLDELAQAIAEKLSISGLLSNSGTEQDAGYRLGSALQRFWNNSKNGIVLLFDLNMSFEKCEFLEKLLRKFIPEIANSLENISPFDNGGNKFRVVIAGRYLTVCYNHLKSESVPINPSLQQLTPFEDKVIRQSSVIYLKQHKSNIARQIADHILYLTGGHPGCMAKVLQRYRESGMSPEIFVDRHGEQIWKEIVRPVVNSIASEFPTISGVDKLMSNNVLRYLNYKVLGKLVNTLKISEVWEAKDFDEYDFSDKLTDATLLNRNPYNDLLHDDITRRLMCLGLRNDKQDEFVQLCRNAQTICEELVRDNSTHNANIWATEYLFQSLQQHALLIGTPEQRRKLRNKFISQDVPRVLGWLSTGRVIREQQGSLLRFIEQDWEFTFTVNYYLRDAEYNSDAIRDLKSEVKRMTLSVPS